MVASYTIGSRVRSTFTIKDFDDTLVDPTTLFVYVLKPSSAGTPDAYEYGVDAELAKDSVGVYHIDMETDEEGMWYYRWVASGNVSVAREGQFYINDSPFV